MAPTQYTRLHAIEEGNDIDLKSEKHTKEVGGELPRGVAVTIFVLVILNLIFAGLWLLPVRNNHFIDGNCVRPQLIYSPARDAIRYEKKRLWRDIDGPNPYTGSPRPEFDMAWSRIIEPMVIKVTSDELSKFDEGDTTVAFKDGSGFIAEMSVYHELHCIKRVRRYLHMDYYYPNFTEEEKTVERVHIDHCLEYWREAAMCRGDITLGTFFYRADGFITSRVYSDHECIDWHALDIWARKRMVNMSDYSLFETTPSTQVL